MSKGFVTLNGFGTDAFYLTQPAATGIAQALDNDGSRIAPGNVNIAGVGSASGPVDAINSSAGLNVFFGVGDTEVSIRNKAIQLVQAVYSRPGMPVVFIDGGKGLL